MFASTVASIAEATCSPHVNVERQGGNHTMISLPSSTSRCHRNMMRGSVRHRPTATMLPWPRSCIGRSCEEARLRMCGNLKLSKNIWSSTKFGPPVLARSEPLVCTPTHTHTPYVRVVSCEANGAVNGPVAPPIPSPSPISHSRSTDLKLTIA